MKFVLIWIPFNINKSEEEEKNIYGQANCKAFCHLLTRSENKEVTLLALHCNNVLLCAKWVTHWLNLCDNPRLPRFMVAYCYDLCDAIYLQLWVCFVKQVWGDVQTRPNCRVQDNSWCECSIGSVRNVSQSASQSVSHLVTYSVSSNWRCNSRMNKKRRFNLSISYDVSLLSYHYIYTWIFNVNLSF